MSKANALEDLYCLLLLVLYPSIQQIQHMFSRAVYYLTLTS